MRPVNRAVMIVKPKEPYRQWTLSLPEPDENITLEQLRSDPTAYLLPEYDFPDEAKEEILPTIFEDVWAEECWHWYEEEKFLPKTMTLGAFFECSMWNFTRSSWTCSTSRSSTRSEELGPWRRQGPCL